MNLPRTHDHELEKRLSACLLDVFIRAGLVLALTMLSYKFFSPVLALMFWALILAVTMYPVQRQSAGRFADKQWLTATMLVLVSVVLIVVSTALLVSPLSDSTHDLICNVKNNTLQLHVPSPSVADWPIVGKQVYTSWSTVHADLPVVVQSMQPKIGELAKQPLNIVAGTGSKVLQFLLSFINAGVIMGLMESLRLGQPR